MTQAEFLAERQTGIGGSDVSSLFDQGWGCRRRLWMDKTGRYTPDFPDEEEPVMFKLGKALEPVFRSEYVRLSGNQVEERPEAIRHPGCHEALVHLDGIILSDKRENDGALEIKAFGAAMFGKMKREGMSVDYSWQLQHGMLCSQLEWGDFAPGCRDNGKLVHFRQEYNSEVGALILEEIPPFWRSLEHERNIPDRLEPDDKRCQTCRYRRQCQGAALMEAMPAGDMEADESLRPIVADLKERKAISKEVEALVEESEETLKAALGDRGAVLVGQTKVYFREQITNRVDAKMLADRYDTLRNAVMKQDKDTALAICKRLDAFLPSDAYKTQSKSRPLRIY